MVEHLTGMLEALSSIPSTVILATQETKIRRIMVLSQHWANSSQDLILKKKKNHKKGIVEWFKV
jgi:hypothetical protein